MIKKLLFSLAIVACCVTQLSLFADSRETCQPATSEADAIPNLKNIQQTVINGIKKTYKKIEYGAIKNSLLLTYASLVSLGISTKYILEAYEMSTQTGTVFIDCLFAILCGAGYLTIASLISGYAMIPMLIFDL